MTIQLYIVRGGCAGDTGKAFKDYREAKSYARTATRIFGDSVFTVTLEGKDRPIVAYYQGKERPA